ncbi:MAG TPA: TonB-dependent receptor [Vicinamibacterales bacterium]|nr:TonB-dependent receptor [Vicinamibacterales bacterium]
MKVRFTGMALAALLSFVPSVWAQQGTSEIRGRVIDSQDAVLPGVTVVVRNQDTGMFRETVSNPDGTYFVSGIVPGMYEITAELQGFRKYSRRDVRLEVGKTTTLDVPLQVGQLEEVVTVSAESPIVDVTSKEVGGSVSSRELVELPSVNRNFVGFVGLLPGVIPSISTESFGSDSITVNGQDPRNNNYMLDGANNNDDVIGQRAGTQARTPIEAVQEFQVITNQFDAEFGRTNGAIINAVTKQGTNAFRGSAFVFAQDASMTAKDFFAKKNNDEKPDTSQWQWGGTLGGPIMRDKAHFFASLERVTIDEGITVNIPARPEFNTTTTEATRVWNTVARFDHQVSANNTWGVRWLREYSPQFNQIIGDVTLAASREEEDTDQTVVGTWNTVLGNTRVNTVRVGWTQEDVSFANPCFNGNGRIQANCLPTLNFASFTDQQSDVAQARVNDAFQIEDTLSWFLPGMKGDHDIKVGVQYQYSQSENDNQGNLNGTFNFGLSDAPFDPNNPSTYPERFSIRVPGASASFNKSKYFAAFAQDKWKLNNKLTLSLGLRYDLETIPIDEVDNPLFADPGDYPTDNNNFQPRIGVAYDVDGESVVRGGYGRFYDKTHFELIGGIYTARVFSDSFNRNFPLNDFDPGPRNGTFPTDPFLVNGPVITDEMRAAIASQFPPGDTIRNTGAVSWDNPDRRMPYTDQITLGYERQLRRDVSVSVDYVHGFSRDLLISRQLNPNQRETPVVAQSPLRRQGSAVLSQALADLRAIYGDSFANFSGSVTIPENAAELDYDAVLLALEKRFSNNYGVRVSYTYSNSRGNTTGAGVPVSNFQVLDDLNLDLNEGPSAQNVPHNFVVSGTLVVPRTGGLTVSGVARALSGSPFSLFNGTIDPDRNGIIAEPLAAGTYSGTGEDAYTVEDYKSERNGAYGPGFFKLDLRVGYNVRLMGRRLDLFAEIFNVTDRVNFANPSGNQAVPASFLILSGYSTSTTPRTVQLGARFAF